MPQTPYTRFVKQYMQENDLDWFSAVQKVKEKNLWNHQKGERRNQFPDRATGECALSDTEWNARIKNPPTRRCVLIRASRGCNALKDTGDDVQFADFMKPEVRELSRHVDKDCPYDAGVLSMERRFAQVAVSDPDAQVEEVAPPPAEPQQVARSRSLGNLTSLNSGRRTESLTASRISDSQSQQRLPVSEPRAEEVQRRSLSRVPDSISVSPSPRITGAKALPPRERASSARSSAENQDQRRSADGESPLRVSGDQGAQRASSSSSQAPIASSQAPAKSKSVPSARKSASRVSASPSRLPVAPPFPLASRSLSKSRSKSKSRAKSKSARASASEKRLDKEETLVPKSSAPKSSGQGRGAPELEQERKSSSSSASSSSATDYTTPEAIRYQLQKSINAFGQRAVEDLVQLKSGKFQIVESSFETEEKDKLLGKGGYGSVFVAQIGGAEKAVKKISLFAFYDKSGNVFVDKEDTDKENVGEGIPVLSKANRARALASTPLFVNILRESYITQAFSAGAEKPSFENLFPFGDALLPFEVQINFMAEKQGERPRMDILLIMDKAEQLNVMEQYLNPEHESKSVTEGPDFLPRYSNIFSNPVASLTWLQSDPTNLNPELKSKIVTESQKRSFLSDLRQWNDLSDKIISGKEKLFHTVFNAWAKPISRSSDFVDNCCRIIQTFARIHGANIIHRDFKLANLVRFISPIPESADLSPEFHKRILSSFQSKFSSTKRENWKMVDLDLWCFETQCEPDHGTLSYNDADVIWGRKLQYDSVSETQAVCFALLTILVNSFRDKSLNYLIAYLCFPTYYLQPFYPEMNTEQRSKKLLELQIADLHQMDNWMLREGISSKEAYSRISQIRQRRYPADKVEAVRRQRKAVYDILREVFRNWLTAIESSTIPAQGGQTAFDNPLLRWTISSLLRGSNPDASMRPPLMQFAIELNKVRLDTAKQIIRRSEQNAAEKNKDGNFFTFSSSADLNQVVEGNRISNWQLCFECEFQNLRSKEFLFRTAKDFGGIAWLKEQSVRVLAQFQQ